MQVVYSCLEMELTLNGHLTGTHDAVDEPVKEGKGEAEENHVIPIVQPHSLLPRPEAPPGSLLGQAAGKVGREDGDEGSLRSLAGSFRLLRDRSSSFSAAIAKTLSAKVMAIEEEVTEIDLKGMKVIVQMKTKEEEDDRRGEEVLKGRISFYSRSNCRDCTAVRRFFRERGLRFVEINVDVFPCREKELIQRTGTSQVISSNFTR